MVIGVLWRRDDDDSKLDVESFKGEVVVMDKDYRENMELRSTSSRRRERASGVTNQTIWE